MGMMLSLCVEGSYDIPKIYVSCQVESYLIQIQSVIKVVRMLGWFF